MATQYLYQGVPVTEEIYSYLVEQDLEEIKSERRFWRGVSSLDALQEKHVPIELLIKTTRDFKSRDLYIDFENEGLEEVLYWLSNHERMIVVLHVIEGYKLTEIAALFGQKYDSVKRSYLRAIKKMKKYFS